jgi:hypothetical protein
MEQTIDGVLVDEASCFSDESGSHHSRVEKEQRKLLTKVSATVARVLEPGEAVRYVASSCSPYSVLELLTTGRLIHSVRRCVLVATDRRLLHLPTSSGLSPRGAVAQIRHGDVEEVSFGALGGKLTMRYRNGKKEAFSRLSGRARKKLATLLPAETTDAPTAAAGRHPLCPRCGEALSLGVARCGRCALPFKEKTRALLLALVVPGGGYFYTGRTLFGVLDGLFEMILLLGLLVGLVEAATGTADWPFVGLMAVLLGIEKLVSVFHTLHYIEETLPGEKISIQPAIP